MKNQPSVTATGEPLLLDAALPEFRFSRGECAVTAAAPDVVYSAARDLDTLSIHSPLLDAFMWARGVPDREDLEAQPGGCPGRARGAREGST